MFGSKLEIYIFLRFFRVPYSCKKYLWSGTIKWSFLVFYCKSLVLLRYAQFFHVFVTKRIVFRNLHSVCADLDPPGSDRIRIHQDRDRIRIHQDPSCEQKCIFKNIKIRGQAPLIPALDSIISDRYAHTMFFYCVPLHQCHGSSSFCCRSGSNFHFDAD